MTRVIDLREPGPSEAEWAHVCDELPAFVWPDCRRMVVVSPHPDDETLGAGGVIGTAVERGLPVSILSVTDGEAAAAGPEPDPELAAIRRAELTQAMARLDPTGSIHTVRLGFADSHVTASIDAITEVVARHLQPSDLVLCPLPDDGHPDHHATAVATIAAADAVDAIVHCFPVWAWHCHDPSDTVLCRGARVPLSDDVVDRKARAVACFVSQLGGPSPVVPAAMLVRLHRPFEVLVRP